MFPGNAPPPMSKCDTQIGSYFKYASKIIAINGT
jgi:hypothetical protein